MTTVTAPQVQCKTVSENRNVAVSFSGKLDAGELLTGTPTIALVSGSGLTFANEAVNTAALTINGLTVPIGEAVQFRVTGGTAGTTYKIRVTCSTDSSPAQTVIGHVTLKVIAD